MFIRSRKPPISFKPLLCVCNFFKLFYKVGCVGICFNYGNKQNTLPLVLYLQTEGLIDDNGRKIGMVIVANSTIKIYYNSFDITLLNNRKIIGVTSGASALVENATKRIITDRLNFGLPFELLGELVRNMSCGNT